MKGILFSLCTFVFIISGFSQTSQVTSANITKLSGNNYRLTINYMGNGMKHTGITLFNGDINNENVISNECVATPGNGSTMINFQSMESPNAILVPGNGNCGGQEKGDPIIIRFEGAGNNLPVIIHSFNAKREGKSVKLSWSTLLETNAKEFVIQNNSGNGYTDIRKLNSSGLANGYTYNETVADKSPEASLYRIKMVALNGTISYSNIETIQGVEKETPEYTIFPNPAPAGSKINISDIQGPVKIEISDNMGRIKTSIINTGNSIDLKNLKEGIYVLRIVTGNSAVSKKIKIGN